MKNEIEHIIFDLGGVLLNIDLMMLSTGFATIMNENEEGMKKVKFEIIPSYEIGKISTEEFLSTLSPYLRAGFRNEDIVNVWNSIILDMPVERLLMLQELRIQYKVHLLSNINDLHASCFEKNFNTWFKADPRKYFDKFFYSHEIGKRKPDINTFKWVLEQIGTDPGKLILIDDMPENIEGARNAGMYACQLVNQKTDIIQLMTELGFLKVW